MMESNSDAKPRFIVVAVFYPNEGSADLVKSVLAEVVPKVHEEPGVEFFALHEAADGRLCLIEAWESRQIWVEHGNADTVKEIVERTSGLLAKPIDVLELHGVPAGGELGVLPRAR